MADNNKKLENKLDEVLAVYDKDINMGRIYIPYVVNEKKDISYFEFIVYKDSETNEMQTGVFYTSKDGKNKLVKVVDFKNYKKDNSDFLALKIESDSEKGNETFYVNSNVDRNGNDIFFSKVHSLIKGDLVPSKEIDESKLPVHTMLSEIKEDKSPKDDTLSLEEVDRLNMVYSKENLPTETLHNRKKTGQKLNETELRLGQESYQGLKQEILTEKLNLSSPQELTLFDSKSYQSTGDSKFLENSLIAITSSDKSSPVAVFTKDIKKDGDKSTEVINFKISKTYFENFMSQESSKSLNIPLGKVEGDYVSYEIEKLKLSQDLTIKDVQVRTATSEMAVLFSALGMQIMDKDGNKSIARNIEHPFNVSVSTDFLSSTLKPEIEKTDAEKKLDFVKEGPAFETLLISQIQLEGRKTPDKIVEVRLPLDSKETEITLYSIPLRIKVNGEEVEENLYLKKDKDGKSSAFLHITGENSKSKGIPKFYEIDLAQLEESSNSTFDNAQNPSLYLGLRDGKNVARVNIDLDYDKNSESLEFLKSVALKEQFSNKVMDEEKVPPLFDGKERTIGKENFNIFTRPKESRSQILSFDNVGIMSKTAPILSEEKDSVEPNNEKVDSSNIIIPDPSDPNPRRPINPLPTDSAHAVATDDDNDDSTTSSNRIINPTDEPKNEETENEKTPDEPSPTSPNPSSNNEEKEIPSSEEENNIVEEGKVKPIDWPPEPKKEKPSKVKNVLIGAFALTTLLGILNPIAFIISIILAGVLIYNEVKPWLSKSYKSIKDWFNRKYDKYKEKTRNLERIIKHQKNLLNEKINNCKNLDQKILEVQQNPNLTIAQKQKQIEKISKKIKKEKNRIVQIQSYIATKELCKEVVKKQAITAKKKEELKTLLKEHKQKSKIESKNIEEFKIKEDFLNNKIAQNEKIIESLKKEQELSKEEDKEINNLKALEIQEKRGTLTDNEKEYLTALRKKFGIKAKKRYKAFSEIDKSIEEKNLENASLSKELAEVKREASNYSAERGQDFDERAAKLDEKQNEYQESKEEIKTAKANVKEEKDKGLTGMKGLWNSTLNKIGKGVDHSNEAIMVEYELDDQNTKKPQEQTKDDPSVTNDKTKTDTNTKTNTRTK